MRVVMSSDGWILLSRLSPRLLAAVLSLPDPYLQWIAATELELRLQRVLTCEMAELPTEFENAEASVQFANVIVNARVFLSKWSLWMYHVEDSRMICRRVFLPGLRITSDQSKRLILSVSDSQALVLELTDELLVKQWYSQLQSLEILHGDAWQFLLHTRNPNDQPTFSHIIMRTTPTSSQSIILHSSIPIMTAQALNDALAQSHCSLNTLQTIADKQVAAYAARLQMMMRIMTESGTHTAEMQSLLRELQKSEEILFEREYDLRWKIMDRMNWSIEMPMPPASIPVCKSEVKSDEK